MIKLCEKKISDTWIVFLNKLIYKANLLTGNNNRNYLYLISTKIVRFRFNSDEGQQG